MSNLIKTQGSNIVIGGKAIFSNPPSIDLLAGLQAFYKLSDLTDSSGNNLTLTNNGDVTFGSGKIGDAAIFSGSNYFTSTPINTAGVTSFTLSTWLKGTGQTGEQLIVGWETNAGPVEIAVYNNTTYIMFNTTSYGGWGNFNEVYSDMNWHHVTLAWDGSTIKLYEDGVMTNLVEAGGSLAASPQLAIGSRVGGSNAFIGSIDAVGIWNRALNEGEVSALYNSGNGLELN